MIQYYADQGMITGNNTEKILLHRLERARGFMDKGKTAAYKAQLLAFSLQVLGFTPRFINLHASAVLIYDASLLLKA